VVVGLLGPLAVSVGGNVVAVTGPKQRAVLATLALQANQVVPVAHLVDAVWGEAAPDRAEHTLQQHVSALRKLLGTDALQTQSPGYVLRLEATDVDDFTVGSREGVDAIRAQRCEGAISSLSAALGLWRGPALADARDTPRLEAAAVALDEQRLAATEAWLEARLQVGPPREVVADLERLVNEHPLRERFRALLMLALYRSGRQADALAAYQAARQVLTEELGIEPSAELRELEQAILTQSPALESRQTAGEDADVYATFRADAHDVGRVQLPDGQVVLLVSGRALVGRDPSALVRLVDSRVSRRHAEIEVDGGRFVLRDLGSTNGTAVNGERVTEQELRHDDLVSIGGVELRFLASGE
jgi:DNA-binding SARP family transcriptional activator